MDLSGLMNQFKDLQGNLQNKIDKMKTEVDTIRVTGQAGIAPAQVKVVVRGNKDCEKVSLGEGFSSLSKSMQEELIVAAINGAYQELETQIKGKIGGLAGGLDLSKMMKFPFDSKGGDAPKDSGE